MKRKTARYVIITTIVSFHLFVILLLFQQNILLHENVFGLTVDEIELYKLIEYFLHKLNT